MPTHSPMPPSLSANTFLVFHSYQSVQEFLRRRASLLAAGRLALGPCLGMLVFSMALL